MTTTRPIIPVLQKLYPQSIELAYLLLRLTAGLMMLPHGWPKLMAGPTAVAATVMTKRGVEPALLFAYLSIIFEVGGAIFIALGLFTRPVAGLLVVEFMVIANAHFAAAGWGGAGGAEFPFLWMTAFVMILGRGGGPYSLDRLIGWEI